MFAMLLLAEIEPSVTPSPIWRVPSVMVVGPVKGLVATRLMVPVPALVNPPGPLSEPLRFRRGAETIRSAPLLAVASATVKSVLVLRWVPLKALPTPMTEIDEGLLPPTVTPPMRL